VRKCNDKVWCQENALRDRGNGGKKKAHEEKRSNMYGGRINASITPSLGKRKKEERHNGGDPS